jgi:hypothetical protein
LRPGSNVPNEVPPTLVTSGWEVGSSTVGWVACASSSSRQSKAPSSPEDEVMLCPCIAICVKMTFSALA